MNYNNNNTIYNFMEWGVDFPNREKKKVINYK